MKTLKIKWLLLSLTIAMLTTACESVKTAIFDQYSYQKTTELKVETSNLMDKATNPYKDHKEEVEKLLVDIQKLMEYEKNKPNNEITFAMWQLLNNKEKNLLAGFFKRWEEKETFSPVFLEESKNQVLEALDLLIQYEIKKDKQSKDSLLEIITNN
jgi:hypothetical protein